MGKRKGFGIFLVYFLTAAFIVACITPFIHVMALSLNDGLDARKGGIFLWPRVFSLANYNQVFKNDNILTAYSITLFRTIAGVLLELALNSAFAYAISKKYLVFRKFFTWWSIVPMYFGAGLIPLFLVLYNLNITNTIWVYILPYMLVPFYIIVFRTFFRSIPDSMEESAKIDGASDFVVFTKFVVPLSLPVFSTVAIFSGVGHWNDWFVGTAFVFKSELWPVQTLLMYILKSADPRELTQSSSYIDFMKGMTGVTVTPEALKMAMIVICALPIVVVYPFLQKNFILGMHVGSVKE